MGKLGWATIWAIVSTTGVLILAAVIKLPRGDRPDSDRDVPVTGTLVFRPASPPP